MRTSLSGPVILYGNDNPQQVSETDAGPNIDFQSNALLDSRFSSLATASGGQEANGGVPSWHNPVEIECLCCIPQAANTSVIAAAQSPTVGGFFTLASANATGIAVNIPLVPYGTAIQPSATTTPVIALDFGFALVTTTLGSSLITITGPTPAGYTSTAVYGSRFFYPGQRLLIAGAGNAAGTLPLFCSVLATDRYAAPGYTVQSAGVVLLNTPALYSGTNLPVGTSDQEFGVAVKPVIKAGAARIYDPAQMTSRTVTVTASGASSGTVTVRGYDIYEQPMSATITITGSGTAQSTKAFGYISSVQLNTGSTLAGTLSIGTGLGVGLPTRADYFEYQTIFYNNVQITGTLGGTPTGLTFSDQTPVATSTTGDVRGTYANNWNGTIRLVYFHQVPISAAKVSNNIDFRGILGVTQA